MAAVPSVEALAVLERDPLVLSWREKAKTYEAEAVALVVESDEADAAATSMLGVGAAIGRAAEAKRVALVKPLNDAVKAINDYFKRELLPFTRSRPILEGRAIDWRKKKARIKAEADARVERERLASEALQAEAVRAEQAGQGAVAEKLLDQAVQAEAHADTAAAAAATPIRNHVVTPMGASTLTKRWSFKVTDAEQIPREYLAVDEVAIRAAIRASARDKDGRPTIEIPGLEIFADEGLAVRG